MKRIFYIFLVLILGIIIFVWYAGAFEKVTIIDQQDGPYIIAGLDHKGSYSKISGVFQEVNNTLKSVNIESGRTLGIYYDNPSLVDEEVLRSFAASILEGENLINVASISQTSLFLDTIANANALVVDLPARSIFCYMIYPMKVYPAFEKWNIEKGNSPTIAYEVYDVQNKKVRYVMQYSN